MVRGAMIGLVLAIGGASIGIAQDTAEECAALDDGAHRLVCYDDLFRHISETSSAVSSPWFVNEEVSRIDDTTSVFIRTSTLEPYQDDYDSRTPTLWVRCVENTTALIIEFDGDYMSDIANRGVVTIRIDEEPARDLRMDVSTNNQSLGLWSGGASIPVIKSMFGASSMIVRAIPVSANPVTVEFDISLLEDEIGPLREACNW